MSRLTSSLSAFVLVLAATPCARADLLVIPPLTISGMSTITTGPTFVVSGNYGPMDMVNVQVAGTVDIASGGYTANAAGVVLSPPLTNQGTVPGSIALTPSGFPFAALMIGNPTLGYFPLFPADANSGLGSPTPPSSFPTMRQLDALFGATFTSLTNGTVLRLWVNDTDYSDNSGSFRVQTVPEPASLVMAALGVAFVLVRRVRLKMSSVQDRVAA